MTSLKIPKSVTKQELENPVDWGEFVGSDKVNLMTPPFEILRAAFADPVKPTEVAYVVVVGAQQKAKKNQRKRNVAASNKNVKDLACEMNQDKSELRVRLESAETNKDVLVATGKNFTRKRLFQPNDHVAPQFKLVVEGDEEDLGSSENRTPQYKLTVEGDEEQGKIVEETAPSMETFLPADDSEKNIQRDSNQNEEVSTADSKQSENLTMLSAKLKSNEGETATTLLNKLLESQRRERKLQLQLRHSGVVAITEDIPYDIAKTKINEIAVRMNEIGGTDTADAALREEYFKLEQEMEKYNNAMMLTDEWQEELDAAEKQWEEDNVADNLEALKRVRKHMPVQVRSMTIDELLRPHSNGRALPESLVKRFKRTNVITLIRMDPEDIERMHPSTLESMRVTGLTLTERRALYAHLSETGAKWKKMQKTDPEMTGRKYKWFSMMKNNFKENLDSYQHHVAKYGPPCNHPRASENCPSGCPLIGRSCPVIADGQVDYSGDYGYPETNEYETSNILSRTSAAQQRDGAGLNAQVKESAKLKRNRARVTAFKRHYKGKLLEVSKASGSCESMDDTMEKIKTNLRHWVQLEASPDDTASEKCSRYPINYMCKFAEALIELRLTVLGFAQRAGVQMSGAKQNGSKTSDPRSLVEARLADELFEYASEFCQYIESTMQVAGIGSIKDNRIFTTVSALRSLLAELHERNAETIQRLEGEFSENSSMTVNNELEPRTHAQLSVLAIREGLLGKK